MATTRDAALDQMRRDRGLDEENVGEWRRSTKSTSYGLGVFDFLNYCKTRNIHPGDIPHEDIINHLRGKSAVVNRFKGVSQFLQLGLGQNSILDKTHGSQTCREFFRRANIAAQENRNPVTIADVRPVLIVISGMITTAGSIAEIPIELFRLAYLFLFRLQTGFRSSDVQATVDKRPERQPPTASLTECLRWRPSAYDTKEENLRALHNASGNRWATVGWIEENAASTDPLYQNCRLSRWHMERERRDELAYRSRGGTDFEKTMKFHGREIRSPILLQRTKSLKKVTVQTYSREIQSRLSADRHATMIKKLFAMVPEADAMPANFKPSNLRHYYAAILRHGRVDLAGTMTAPELSKQMRHSEVSTTTKHYVPPEVPDTVAARWAAAGPERYKKFCNTEWLLF